MGDIFGARAVMPRGHKMDVVKKTPHLSLVKNEMPKKKQRDVVMKKMIDEFLAVDPWKN